MVFEFKREKLFKMRKKKVAEDVRERKRGAAIRSYPCGAESPARKGGKDWSAEKRNQLVKEEETEGMERENHHKRKPGSRDTTRS